MIKMHWALVACAGLFLACHGYAEDSWDYASPDESLQYNPMEDTWDYASPDETLRYNPLGDDLSSSDYFEGDFGDTDWND